jgi:hypothetical protein
MAEREITSADFGTFTVHLPLIIFAQEKENSSHDFILQLIFLAHFSSLKLIGRRSTVQ